MERTSIVQNVKILSVSTSSIVQAGDTRVLTPTSNVIAVQKQDTTYYESEHTFQDYPIFKRPFHPINYEVVSYTTVQENPTVKVGTIEILGVAASSAIRIGNTDFITSQSRVKHIRHFAINPYE